MALNKLPHLYFLTKASPIPFVIEDLLKLLAFLGFRTFLLGTEAVLLVLLSYRLLKMRPLICMMFCLLKTFYCSCTQCYYRCQRFKQLYSRDLNLPQVHKATVTLLMGTNVPKLFSMRNVRKGSLGQTIAVKLR